MPDVVIASFGYWYHPLWNNEFAVDVRHFSQALLEWASLATTMRGGNPPEVVLLESFPQHFASPSGDYWIDRDFHDEGCRVPNASAYREFGSWRTETIRAASVLPIVPTVNMTLPWAALKHGGVDCTHWKFSGEVALPFVDWFWNKKASAAAAAWLY
jgi:hypothetical protein